MPNNTTKPQPRTGLVIGLAALSNQIFAGHLSKDGKTWKAGKQDVTSDVLSSVIQLVRPGHAMEVNVAGKPKFRIIVEELGKPKPSNIKVVKEETIKPKRQPQPRTPKKP